VQFGKVFAMDDTAVSEFRANALAQVVQPKNWRCLPVSATDPRSLCRLVARAEQLNVYPDALQLVWASETSHGSSSGAALTAAAYRDTANVNDLCNAQHRVHLDTGTYNRSFQRVDREDSIRPGPPL
jgi:hypothetical protein